MIKGAKQTNKAIDTGATTEAQLSYLNQTRNVPMVSPYGLFCAPPVGSTWVVMPLLGNDNAVVGFGSDYVNRPKGLTEGEVVLYNTITKSFLKLSKSGDIDIESIAGININATGNVTINCTKAIVNGDAEVNGDTTVLGDLDVGGNFGLLGNAVINGTSTALNHISGTISGTSHIHLVAGVPSTPPVA